MPYDPLFMALAQAKSQPSHALRTAESGIGAASDILGGYLQGKEFKEKRQEESLKPFEIWSKISDSAGPDVANNIFKQRGIPIPDMTGGGAGVQRTPEELARTGGGWATKQLGNQNILGEMQKRNQDIENTAPYTPEQVKGMLSENPKMAEALIAANPSGQIPYRQVQAAISTIRPNMMGGYFQGRLGTMQLSQLPSQLGPNTAAGAGYQVKVAARQGKSLIAKATTPQSLALASADLSRAVQRSAPLSETIGAGNYAQSLPTLWSQFQQKLTSDPNGPDVPLLRKQLYDSFNELDKAATPWVANHLQNMEDNGTNSTFGANWGATKNRELGLNIPDIPFDAGSAQNPNVSTGIPTGYKMAKNAQGQIIRSKDNWATFEPVPQGGP